MSLADQLTLARILAVPVVIVLFVANFEGHYWWATGVFIAAMTTDFGSRHSSVAWSCRRATWGS
jgi:phosphatidylglycerophosphate synthase